MRTCLRWLLWFAFLALVGAGTFVFVRDRPRHSILGPNLVWWATADGDRIFTCCDRNDKEGLVGPIVVWDPATGTPLASHMPDVIFRNITLSPGHRLVSAFAKGGTLCLIDADKGKLRTLDVGEKALESCTFSPEGRWLALSDAVEDTYIDTLNSKIAAHSLVRFHSFLPYDQALRFKPGGAWSVLELATGDSFGVSELKSDVKKESHVVRLVRGPGDLSALWAWEEEWSGRIQTKQSCVVQIRAGRRFEIKLTVDVSPHLGNFVFSPDGAHLASWVFEDSKQTALNILDCTTGQKTLTKSVLHANRGEFSPDGTLFWFVHGHKPQTLTMFDVAQGKVLWERGGYEVTQWAGDLLLHQNWQHEPLLFIEPRSGAVLAKSPADVWPGVQAAAFFTPLQVTPDGRYLRLVGKQRRDPATSWWGKFLEKQWPERFGQDLHVTLVMESATRRELFRVVGRGRQGQHLSADGRTLITCDQNLDTKGLTRIDVWDVSPTRAWTWAVLAALGAATALAVVRLLWQRGRIRRARPAVSS